MMQSSSGTPPPKQLWTNIDPDTLPDFLKKYAKQRPTAEPTPTPTPAENLAVSSFGGHGTLEALQVTRVLEDEGIPCCLCGVSALIYYGAGRIRHDWEICVPTALVERAVARVTADEATYVRVAPRPYAQPGSRAYTYARFQGRGVGFYFVLVPADDVHLAVSAGMRLQRSHRGLPYPPLAVLVQSFLDTADQLSLCDAVDGSNVSEQWGRDNLDLEGVHDVEWAARTNQAISERSGGNLVLCGFVPSRPVRKRDLWALVVTNKTARLGWTRPEHLFATRFRLRGSPDPWLLPSDCS